MPAALVTSTASSNNKVQAPHRFPVRGLPCVERYLSSAVSPFQVSLPDASDYSADSSSVLAGLLAVVLALGVADSVVVDSLPAASDLVALGLGVGVAFGVVGCTAEL